MTALHVDGDVGDDGTNTSHNRTVLYLLVLLQDETIEQSVLWMSNKHDGSKATTTPTILMNCIHHHAVADIVHHHRFLSWLNYVRNVCQFCESSHTSSRLAHFVLRSTCT
jgi:hypothetical protein